MIERKEISTAPNEPRDVYYRYGGKEMGRVSNNGDFNMDYAASISDRTITPDTNNTDGAFRHGSTTGSSSADFDQNYQAINSYDQGSTAGDYVVRGGETLSSIAAQVYGDSLLWYKIAQANGLSVDAALVEGTSLRLPAGVTRNTYNASTFKPYDPGEAIGDVSPTTPEPPKQNKCGVFGQILLAVVAVAVTVVTGNPLLANLASQGVGLATGIQEKFDFKGLALSAIGGGVARGVNAAVGVGKTALGAGLRAAASSAITQGIGVATGLQDKFSWAGVAGAGIGAGIGFKVGQALPNSATFETGPNGLTRIADEAGRFNQFVSNTASSIANAATRSAIDGSNFGDNIIASIPDVIGQALGGQIGDSVGRSEFLDKLGPVGDIINFLNDVTDTVYAPVETVGTAIGNAITAATKPAPSQFNLNKHSGLDGNGRMNSKNTASLRESNLVDGVLNLLVDGTEVQDIDQLPIDTEFALGAFHKNEFAIEPYLTSEEDVMKLRDYARAFLPIADKGIKLLSKGINDRYNLSRREEDLLSLMSFANGDGTADLAPIHELVEIRSVFSSAYNRVAEFVNNGAGSELTIHWNDREIGRRHTYGRVDDRTGGGYDVIFAKNLHNMYEYDGIPYRGIPRNYIPNPEVFKEFVHYAMGRLVFHEIGYHVGAQLPGERVGWANDKYMHDSGTRASWQDHTAAYDRYLDHVYNDYFK